MKLKVEYGERLGPRAPHGYRKDKSDAEKIVSDEEAAKVVQHIFPLCVSGKGLKPDCMTAETEKVITSNYYYDQKIGVRLTGLNLS